MMQFKRQVLSALVAFAAATSAVSAAAPQDEECSQEILLSYFPASFVGDTLTRFNVPKDQWDAITKELSVKDKDIIKQVEAKAGKMTPNPLKDPQQRQAAVKLFRDTLLENFSAVMKAHGVTDDKQIQSMLDDIQQQKAKRFARCMEMQRNQKAAPGATGPQKDDEDDSDMDSDDESEDDSDSDSDSEESKPGATGPAKPAQLISPTKSKN